MKRTEGSFVNMAFSTIWWLNVLILSFCLTSSSAECESYSSYIDDAETKLERITKCERTDLTTLVYRLPSDVNILHIRASFLNIMDLKEFDNFHNLKQLHIKNSSILIIMATSISELKRRLTILDISDNDISTIHLSLFCGFKNLQLLNISRNNLANGDFFGNCSNFFVKTLDLSYNKISNISSQLAEMIHISNLNLTGNLISSINADFFSKLDQLVSLNLAENQIKHIPAGIFKHLRSLNTLNLSKNKINSLTMEAFSGLNSLRTIDLSSNNISSFSVDVLYNLQNVRHFLINNNSMSDLNVQDLADYLPHLWSIDLDGNSWTCSKLWEIMWSLREKRIMLEPGRNFKVKNFNGIACNDDTSDEEYTVDRSDKKTGKNLDLALEKVRHYFERDFKQSEFYKFFDGKLLKRFEETFRDARFFKHVDDDFLNSKFYKYFTNGYINATFFEYLNKKIDTIKSSAQNGKTDDYEKLFKKAVAEYFNPILKPNSDGSRKDASTEEKSENFYILIILVFMLMLLAVMFSMFLCKYIGCVNFLRARNSRKVVQNSEDHLL